MEVVRTDEELVSRFIETVDNQWLGQLFERYRPLAYGLCLQLLKDPELAQDAVMDVFEALPDKLKNHSITYFRSWFYQVCKNHCLMKLRKAPKKSTDSVMEFTADVHPIEEAIQKEEQLSQLEKCLEELKDGQQECVRLFFLEERSYAEVSQQTQLELKKVKSYIQNGKRNLKLCMEKHG